MATSSDLWRRLESLFYKALDLDPAARRAFVDECCAGDSALRKDLESLLASADQPIDFLHKPIQHAAQQVVLAKTSTLTPGARFGRYENIATVGAGGMGEVYLARDPQLRRNVALKLLAPALTQDDRALRRFEEEAIAASRLSHPNILTVYEFGQVEGAHYIATEHVEGQTLRQRIDKGRLSVAEATDISSQVCSALVVAHEHGIVHRDIKPANVMVRNDGIVKLLDFGIAKLSDEASASVLQTVLSTSHPETVVGTIRYMSPEQARGRAVDGRSDLFSLGSLMYQLVTGKPAFPGDTASDIIAEILKGEPLPLSKAVPDVPAQFEAIVHRALRKERGERYQSAAEMLDALQEFRKESEFQQKLFVQITARRNQRDRTPQPIYPDPSDVPTLSVPALATGGFPKAARTGW
jgi:eukaryotic-like serine/threonine-protein kinase